MIVTFFDVMDIQSNYLCKYAIISTVKILIISQLLLITHIGSKTFKRPCATLFYTHQKWLRMNNINV